MRATGRTGMRAARRKRSRSYQVTPGAPDPRRGTLKMRVTTLTGWTCHTWSHPGGFRTTLADERGARKSLRMPSCRLLVVGGSVGRLQDVDDYRTAGPVSFGVLRGMDFPPRRLRPAVARGAWPRSRPEQRRTGPDIEPAAGQVDPVGIALVTVGRCNDVTVVDDPRVQHAATGRAGFNL